MTSAFDIVELRWYFLFPVGLSVYFAVIASKNLQKSSAIQNISVTLALVIIAIFVCSSMYINTLKLQQISLITKSIDTYNSSNSRYIMEFEFLQPKALKAELSITKIRVNYRMSLEVEEVQQIILMAVV